MSEQLLTILKLCLLLLLYLFFFRVLRAVWVEIKGPAMVAPTTSRRAERRERRAVRASGQPALHIVDPPEQRGQVFALEDEMTLGRAPGCQITLEDSFVSQVHARIFTSDDQVLVEDLGSTNGTYLNRQRVSGPMPLQRGDRLQVGNTVVELR